MKRYIRSTKYTIEYDDERIDEAADIIHDYLLYEATSQMNKISERGVYDFIKIIPSKLADSINDYLVSQGDGVTNFIIDTYGEVKHAHSIGNNNRYRLLIVGDNTEIVCGSIDINAGIYGGEVYVCVNDLNGNIVGNTYELHPTRGLLINGEKPH